MARNGSAEQSDPPDAPAEKIEPIDHVERELVRPDGTTVVVRVPVYPPFRLGDSPSPRKPAADRVTPSLKRRRDPRAKRSPDQG